jgi:hypothetical protein
VLREGIASYHAACERFGRAPGPVVLRHMPGPAGAPVTADDVSAYEDAGLDELLYSYATRSADELLEVLEKAPH